MRILKRPESHFDLSPYGLRTLPILQDVAIYYRQSTEAQIGNISTLLQTVDMVEHLKKMGWQPERIKMIDLDGGVSGTKGIRERPGMSLLFDLIENDQIGAVAAQDVDRFFRETAQIETNIFIDACRRHHVLILTPTYIYDFAHPIQGPFHIQLFREYAQQAADYIDIYIRGKLQKARNYLFERGLYSGSAIAIGYMVDMRTRLPDGGTNPHYRKYVRFQPWADVALSYFELFRANNGDLGKTLLIIGSLGLGLPEVTPDMIPVGFIWATRLKNNSSQTGQIVLGRHSLEYLLSNVAYIGHWVHKNVITRWNNHEAIVPRDLFMYAFNRLSPTGFKGEQNQDYVSFVHWQRGWDSKGKTSLPTYHEVIYSDDIKDQSHVALHTSWRSEDRGYRYILREDSQHIYHWSTLAQNIDRSIDRLLFAHLEIVADNILHDKPAAVDEKSDAEKMKKLELEIQRTQQANASFLASLSTLSNSEMIGYIQGGYEIMTKQLNILTSQLEAVQTANNLKANRLVNTRQIVADGLVNFQTFTSQQKITLFDRLATHINISKVTKSLKVITICWRDGTTSSLDVTRRNRKSYEDVEDI